MDLFVSEARKVVDEKLAKAQELHNKAVKGEINTEQLATALEGFSITSIPINLNSCTPTKINVTSLSKQLNDMGLNCEYTQGDKLQGCIDNVHNQLHNGAMQSFGIYKPKNGGESVEFVANGEYYEYCEGWTPGSVGDKQGKLLTIIGKDNFEYLHKQYADFPYAVANDDTTTEKKSTVEGIEQLFVECAKKSAATVVQGINLATFDATFANMLGINESSVLSNYATHGKQNICIVLNYNSSTRDCDGVGILYVEWKVGITNYKEKKNKVNHVTSVTLYSRSVVYTDDKLLDKHYNAVVKK